MGGHRKLAWCVVFAATLVSCSSPTVFVFQNLTTASAHLTLELRSALPQDPDGLRWPALTPKLSRWTRWQPLPKAALQLDEERRHISMVVPPGESARLAGTFNYPGHSLPGLEVFPIVMLTVHDEETETSVTVEGPHALLAFQRWNDRMYVFTAHELRIDGM